MAAARGSRSDADGAGFVPSSTEHSRPEDLVHALAQLPDEVSLRVPCDSGRVGRLRLLAAAYSLGDRAEVHSSLRYSTDLQSRPDREYASLASLVESLWPGQSRVTADRVSAEMLAGQRVALISNVPARYRLELFRGLADRLDAAAADLRVFFLAPDASSRPWLDSGDELGFSHEFLRSISIPIRHRRPRAPLDLRRRLRHYSPTMVLAAGFSPFTTSRAAAYANHAGVPLGIWSGEIATTRTARSRPRRIQRQRLVRKADFGIAYGSLAERYLKTLADDLPVVIGRNTSVAAARDAVPGIADDTVRLLTVGDLASDRKGIDMLMDALALRPGLDCQLTVEGDGRRRAELERRAREDLRVRFVGALAGAELVSLYARSDAFLFPSREDVFGLVLVEAMAAGLATAVSASPGAVGDLAAADRNCLVVERNEPREWAATIDRLVRGPELRERLGKAGRMTVAGRWTVAHAVDGMLAGLRLGLMAAPRGGRSV